MGFVHLFSKWLFFDYVSQIIYHGFLFVLILFLFSNINIYPSQNSKNMNYLKINLHISMNSDGSCDTWK